MQSFIGDIADIETTSVDNENQIYKLELYFNSINE